MLRLWLLRHAKSAWDDPGREDFTRPLSPRGQKACRGIGRHMAQRNIQPDLVLCSPATRTRQTWERLQEHLGQSPKARFDPQLYLADPGLLLDLLQALPPTCRDVLLIGHNPGLEQLALRLAGTGAGDALPRLAGKYPTGALAELCFTTQRWAEVERESGNLASFVTPKELGQH